MRLTEDRSCICNHSSELDLPAQQVQDAAQEPSSQSTESVKPDASSISVTAPDVMGPA